MVSEISVVKSSRSLDVQDVIMDDRVLAAKFDVSSRPCRPSAASH